MIQKELVEKLVEAKVDGTRYFSVDVRVSENNDITVEIDSEEGVDIDFCVELSRFIEEKLDREVEDFNLEVGSAGLTSPFKIFRQWQNSIGKEVEVLASDGRKYVGVVTAATPDSFEIDCPVMERRDGDKRKRQYINHFVFGYNEIKYTKYTLNIK